MFPEIQIDPQRYFHCSELFERHKSPNGETNTVPLGQVVLRIIYDDDAYCARVVASKPNEV